MMLTSQCYSGMTLNSQDHLTVTETSLTDFRQLSIRVLSAYKRPPRYIGSTDQWHLFLKKETLHRPDKPFSSIFGYKIPRRHDDIQNGWALPLPSIAIDPDNCPNVSRFNDDKSRFSLPSGKAIENRCLNR
ncbi:hypothetical protein Q4488_10155 [Amphritea sp. 1_MG-2023]|uniref:hypothetical protein n=1 Tax=Amphritea sp. 1_MG-2023 TaxID=3062670 RepID=UPI0026E46B4E|nr:hypothetical protein [Amphritea sp. 1_MG-2023]MDO6563743.1 hypothetical protein [Amphritea sp. 1_MG-2023]